MSNYTKMRYRYPADVRSPKDRISEVQVLYDGGEQKEDDHGFSLAIVTWESKKAYGIRWNISAGEYKDSQKKNGQKECVGNPVSHGHPTWFIVPDVMFDSGSHVMQAIFSRIKKLK